MVNIVERLCNELGIAHARLAFCDARINELEAALVQIAENCDHNLCGPGLCNNPCAPCLADKTLRPDPCSEEANNV